PLQAGAPQPLGDFDLGQTAAVVQPRRADAEVVFLAVGAPWRSVEHESNRHCFRRLKFVSFLWHPVNEARGVRVRVTARSSVSSSIGDAGLLPISNREESHENRFGRR